MQKKQLVGDMSEHHIDEAREAFSMVETPKPKGTNLTPPGSGLTGKMLPVKEYKSRVKRRRQEKQSRKANRRK